MFSEAEVARAVLDHGEWDQERGVYPGLEKLLKDVPIKIRDELSELYRLKAQLQRLKAVKIARELIMKNHQ